MTETREKCDEELKKRTIRMNFSSERTVTQDAESLGISSTMLYRWRNKYTPHGDKAEVAQQQNKMCKLFCGMLNWKRKPTFKSSGLLCTTPTVDISLT